MAFSLEWVERDHSYELAGFSVELEVWNPVDGECVVEIVPIESQRARSGQGLQAPLPRLGAKDGRVKDGLGKRILAENDDFEFVLIIRPFLARQATPFVVNRP